MPKPTFIVARMADGVPFDFLHSVSDDGMRHMVCTNMVGAMQFQSLDAAADAAGDCMDRRPGEEYAALRPDVSS